MTPTFCCGFECGVSGAHWTLAGTSSFDTGTVRSGARSLRCNPTAGTGSAVATALRDHYSSGTRHIGRAYIYFATLPNADTIIIGMANSTTGPVIRFKQSDSNLYAAVGTTLGASGVTVTTGQWYRLDWDMNVNTSGNDLCDLRVNGTACGQAVATGLSSAPGAVTRFGITSGTITADLFFDDFVASSTAADYPIGAGYVNHFVPTADGTHNVAGANDFERTTTGTDIVNATTTAFQLVDDVPLDSGASVDWINMIAPPNATDYVECIFGPAPGITTPTAAPRTVEAIAGIHQAATTTGNMEIRINDNGTLDTMYTATGVAGVTSVAYVAKGYAAGPAGAWVIGGGGNGDFTDLRVRFGSPAALDVVPDQYFDCIMLEAEFAEAGQVLTAGTPVVTFTAAPATRVVGSVTRTAGAPVVTLTAPTATRVATMTRSATAPLVTFTAPTAARVATMVRTATAPLVTMTAPPATAVADGGSTTLNATAPVVTFTAPAATRIATHTASATVPFVTMTAPSAGVALGGTTIEATAPVVTFTAPSATAIVEDQNAVWTAVHNRMKDFQHRGDRQHGL